jgi:hypothetical protein
MHLMGMHLASVYLMDACLMSMHLTGVLLMGVYLMSVYLMSVCLMDMHLTGVHLMGAYLMSVFLMGVCLIRHVCQGHILHGHASQMTLLAQFSGRNQAPRGVNRSLGCDD